MTDKIISMMPQLLCKQLAADLGAFLENRPGASPTEMLAQCDQIMTEIGAVSDGKGGWILPDEETRS